MMFGATSSARPVVEAIHAPESNLRVLEFDFEAGLCRVARQKLNRDRHSPQDAMSIQNYPRLAGNPVHAEWLTAKLDPSPSRTHLTAPLSIKAGVWGRMTMAHLPISASKASIALSLLSLVIPYLLTTMICHCRLGIDMHMPAQGCNLGQGCHRGVDTTRI